jgi:tetratricopeptide (TPR) repeat protein
MPEPPKYDFDVFISYSHKDEKWVTKTLLPRLKEAGLRVCIDFPNFKPGKAALHNMRDAVKHSQWTLLVMTPDWVTSEWTAYEGILAQMSDPAGVRQRVIPVLLQKCDIPEDISILTYVDFTRPDRDEDAWRMLLTAFGKPPEQKPPVQPQREDWFLAHPYPMPPNFTGRVAERKMLTDWLNADATHPLLILRALGGFGKSALAWHWLMNDVTPPSWPRVVWWSFYEGDASFDNFLARTLEYLSGGEIDPRSLGPRQQLDKVLQLLHQEGTLLVLDGFERELRAYGGLNAAYQGDEAAKGEASDRDCICLLAELFLRSVATLPNVRAKVLLTTRLCPCALEAKGGGFLQGCREEELEQMEPADAVEFFHARGIRGTHTEIEAACAPYGYHPLSLRLLAGLIVSDLQQPGDIAAANRLDVSGDLIQRQHHVLEAAYNSLTPARQKLLGRIACFRSPVKYDALKALAETVKNSSASLDADLQDLVSRGLLHHDTKETRFDLHPIVRRYAYDRLTASDRAAAHTRLRDYFAAVPKPDKVKSLEDMAPVIELYHHTVRAGQSDEAFQLFRDRLLKPLSYQLGAYQLIIDLLRALFPDGEDCPPRLKDEHAQALTLNALADSYAITGQLRHAVPLCERANDILGNLAGNKELLVTALMDLSALQTALGTPCSAEANVRRAIVLCQEIRNQWLEAIGHAALGWLLSYCGAWAESETELGTAMKALQKLGNSQSEGLPWAWFKGEMWASLAQCGLLRLRSAPSSAFCVSTSMLDSARRALELADENARTSYPVEREYLRALWLLGAAHCVAGQYDKAERHLHEALERCRRINAVSEEADILIDLTRLRAANGQPDEAHRLAEEVLLITERSGDVLQGADAHLELAKLALGRGDEVVALEHAQKARELATCDGPPDYTYKVAYDEARALLEQLGQG